ncbi:MAG TPA: hypothetical protein VF787_21610, partial [Thermoanaerobaculia bacterium]
MIAGAITVLCTVVTVWRCAQPGDLADRHVDMRRLSCRPLVARLSGLQYAPLPRTGDCSALAELGLTEHATRLFIAARSENPVATVVLTGNRERAKHQLERMTGRSDAMATTWSDYAALLHDSAAPGDAFALTTALAATDHALDIEPFLPEALFNRAVILETLSFRIAALKAYDDYLWVDAKSPWSDEARQRQLGLKTVPSVPRRFVDLADLRRAAVSDDVLFINDLTVTSPELVRPLAEAALGRWGERTLAHDFLKAAEWLAVTRIVGTSLERRFGDALLAETVRAIETSSDPSTLARAHVALSEARYVALRNAASGKDPQISSDNPLISAQFATCPCTNVRFGDFRDAFVHYADHGFAQTPSPRTAAEALRDAERLFAAQNSPMQLAARFAVEMEEFRSKDFRRGVIDKLARRTPSRYRLLTAHIESVRASAFVRDGQAREALTSLQAVHDTYQQLGEIGFANRTRHDLAAVYSGIGDTNEAWWLRSETFKWLDEQGGERLLAYGIYQAAADALRGNRFDLAHSLLNVVVESEAFDRIYDEALIWRAAAANSAGLKRTARRHIDVAQRALRSRTTDREHLRAELVIAAVWFEGM